MFQSISIFIHLFNVTKKKETWKQCLLARDSWNDPIAHVFIVFCFSYLNFGQWCGAFLVWWMIVLPNQSQVLKKRGRIGVCWGGCLVCRACILCFVEGGRYIGKSRKETGNEVINHDIASTNMALTRAWCLVAPWRFWALCRPIGPRCAIYDHPSPSRTKKRENSSETREDVSALFTFETLWFRISYTAGSNRLVLWLPKVTISNNR